MTARERHEQTETWWLLVRGTECIHATKDRALSDRLAITYQDVRQVRHDRALSGGEGG